MFTVDNINLEVKVGLNKLEVKIGLNKLEVKMGLNKPGSKDRIK